MQSLDNNTIALLALVRAGLWEQVIKLLPYNDIDFSQVLIIAKEQSVVGLVTAGLDNVADGDVPQEYILKFVGLSLQLERRNMAMNAFIRNLIEGLRVEGIDVLLIKGQGIAQCYEKPLWRFSGDVDFLSSKDNYLRAKQFLIKLSSSVKDEERYSQHLGLNIDSWYVEIHGTLRTGLSTRIDCCVDAVQRDVFKGGKVRPWMNDCTQVLLPSVEEDVFFIFTHFIKHFYKGGISLRQICDWIRLLWTYRSSISIDWLEIKLRKAGLVKEWKAFAALAVNYIGTPAQIMPFYDVNSKIDKERGKKILEFILSENRRSKVKNTWELAKVFPWKVLRYSPSIFLNVNWLKVKERIFYNR